MQEATPAPKFEPSPAGAPQALAAKAGTAVGTSVSSAGQPSRVEPDTPLAWREELAGRVQEFRQKRAGMRGREGAIGTLDLDFESAERGTGGEMEQDEYAGGGWGEIEHESSPSQVPGHEDAAFDSVQLEKSAAGIRVLSGAAVQAGELSLDRHDRDAGPVEVVLESDGAGMEGHAPSSEVNPRQLLGRRFAAGLLDACVLVAGAAIFGAIFWYLGARAGGVSFLPFTSQPLVLGTLAFTMACLLFFYFALSVALAASTPGLRWMGLGICNLEGNAPSGRESLARAFGYLVSISALFLGFAWALFDVDGLTWHDLISGTYVTERS